MTKALAARTRAKMGTSFQRAEVRRAYATPYRDEAAAFQKLDLT